MSRAEELLPQMTLEEKIGQLIGFWLEQAGGDQAPMVGSMAKDSEYDKLSAHGIGHLTRVYGTRPVDPVSRAKWLWAEQRKLRERSRLGIGAIVHEECLTGFTAWQATAFPTPLAWGASFDSELVREVGRHIGEDMRSLGIHQGLAPVLDVVRDPRWGRVDECISEDPYLVGTLGTAFVKGLQSAGIDATLKHFVGYSNSQAGRNHAPVHMGKRELHDVFLPPFEMAVREGGARSVMNSYTEIDGVPVASNPKLLTDTLRGEWGFDGTVVGDYFTVAFLEVTHRVAENKAEAAVLALKAGIDVELPSGDAYPKLAALVHSGDLPVEFVDKAVLRVLREKERLGLLAPDDSEPPTSIDLDKSANRKLARRLAEESLVLLRNDGTLPLRKPARIAVIGPNASDERPLMGCYSFINHVLAHHPGVDSGVHISDVAASIKTEFPGAEVVVAPGCEAEGGDTSGFAEATSAAADADVAIAVVGDRAGLFGRGTVGEGNDTDTLRLPGVQQRLVEELCNTGTPVVLVVLSGRPYALDWALSGPTAPAAALQAFFPGEEGGTAIARVLSGAVNPSGHLPVSIPRSAGAQPFYYMHPVLGGPNEVTSVDTTPPAEFGFGLTYTDFKREALSAPANVKAGDTFTASVKVTNIGGRAGTDVVQLYARDLVGSVTRPVAQLLAYARVDLEPGESKEVCFIVPTQRLAFHDRDMKRIVEPGETELWVGNGYAVKETTARMDITGAVYEVTSSDPLMAKIRICAG